MAKKKWLFHIFKKLFLCDTQSHHHKSSKRSWRWVTCSSSKKLKQLPQLRTESNLENAREEQMKHAMNVARATAVAAEAAVAAAQAAAAVVRLTGMSKTTIRSEMEMKDWAAIRIQTAFRGYLARKALRALKGLVRLQAIVRGQAVRRRVRNELKRSPSSTKLICLGRSRTSDSDAGVENGSKFRLVNRRKIELGEAVRAERLWNDRIYSKEELNSPSLRRHKDRMRQYSYSHRERQMQFAQILEEPMSSGSYSDRHGIWVRQHWTPGQPQRREERGTSLPTPRSNTQRSSILRRQNSMEEESSYSPFSNPRRSLCQLRERPSSGEVSPSTCSSIYPSYMGCTESAKAKMRSMSTPRQRIRYLDHYHSDCYECGRVQESHLCKNTRPTCAAAFNCETMSSDSKGNNCSNQIRSLSMRSLKQ